MRFEKGSLVVASAVAMVLLCTAAYAAYGPTEAGLRATIRWTARFSVTAFLLAFAARPLRQIWSSTLSGWMLRNRRYLGLSFAVAHFTHLAAILGVAFAFPEPFRTDLNALTLLGGGFGYLLIALMTLTSTDRTAAWLSRKNWRRLHTLGMYTLWVIFLQSYLGRVAAGGLAYAPVTLALIGVVGLRTWVRFGSPAGASSVAPAAN